MFSPGKLKSDADVFMFMMDELLYEEVALAWYQTSGKYDKNSVGRMLSSEKYKNDLVRASIDNSLIFAPTANPVDEIQEDVVGNIILVCKGAIVKAIGIAIANVECPDGFLECERLLMIHVLSTFNSPLNINAPFVQADHLPKGMMKLAEFVADKIDLGMAENLTMSHEYERHILFARSYQNMLEKMMNFETPVQQLEIERKKRIYAMIYHLEHKKTIVFPMFRHTKYSLKNIVTLFNRYRTKK